MKPRLLDLFCCEGGAAAGYHAAGFEVHGVDSEEMGLRYLQSGASSFGRGDATSWPLDDYDAVHASPPCKDHTSLISLHTKHGTGWMLGHTIARLRKWHAQTGRPFIVENVDSASTRAEMNGAVMLCGSMFGLGVTDRHGTPRILKRHRHFVTSFPLLAPPDQCSGRPVVGVYGHGGGGQMTRGYKGTLDESRAAMQMPWASRNGCSQAIPPAYTQFLGELMLAHIRTLQKGVA